MAQEPAGVRGQQSTESNDTGQDIKLTGLVNVLAAIQINSFIRKKERNTKLFSFKFLKFLHRDAANNDDEYLNKQKRKKKQIQ